MFKVTEWLELLVVHPFFVLAKVELLEVETVAAVVFVRNVVISVVLGVGGISKGVNSVSLLVGFELGFSPQKVFLVKVG